MSRPESSTVRTAALAAVLAVVAVVLLAADGSYPVLADGFGRGASWPAAAGFAVAFGLAELCLLHVEVRRQAYTLTLSGLPLAAGLLLLPTRELVLARVIGSSLVLLLQRTGALKLGYNLAAYAAEAAGASAVLVGVAGTGRPLTPALAAVILAVVVAADQLMTGLVMLVICWHQGRLTREDRARMVVPAAATSAMSTTAAIAGLILTRSAVGAGVLAVLLAGGAASYRGYQVLHRRHRTLQQLHDFVGLSEGVEALDGLAGRMLEAVRELLHASGAEFLHLDGETDLSLRVADGEPLTVDRASRFTDDWLTRRVRMQGIGARVVRATRDPVERAWLADQHLRDALVVPLPASTGDGVLILTDRLGETGSFTADDERLLQTLAGHLSMAVRSSRLLTQLRYDATHDGLTGLANRLLLTEQLQGALDAGHDDLAVLLLDLDRFKEVNDTLGHHTGDALLRVIGERLTRALPAGSVVARLGGDEFAALVPGLGADVAAAAAAVAARVGTEIGLAVQLGEHVVSTRASIGVAPATPGATPSDLLRHADTAMYAIKNGDDDVLVFTPELERGRAEHLALLADLRLALERGELRVHYQPQLELVTGRIIAVEALVRWAHPRLGMLGPDAFIPLAESSGLIGALTRQVLRSALGQCAAWRQAGLQLSVAVNLSARTVGDPGLVDTVAAALREVALPAESLVLEITESSVMHDPDRAVAVLERLAGLGVRLSLDDFGTGYSSLAYLQRLPVQEVKIDRSFVTGLALEADRSEVLVRSILSLAGNLGLTVVAEGVEDAATLERLQELGCDVAQGYLIGRPQAAETLPALVARRAGDRASSAAAVTRPRRLSAVLAS